MPNEIFSEFKTVGEVQGEIEEILLEHKKSRTMPRVEMVDVKKGITGLFLFTKDLKKFRKVSHEVYDSLVENILIELLFKGKKK